MSLSFAIKMLVFVFLAIGSGIAGQEYAWPLVSYFKDAREITARETRISKRSIVYRIPANNHLDFAFAQPVTNAKVIVSPAVTHAVRDQKGGFKYGLRLRWFDVEGNKLSEHAVHLQAGSPDEVFASGATWRFFRTRPELVAGQDQLRVESPSPAVSLEIESFDVGDGIVGIDVRVFQQLAFLGNQSLAAYRRLSDSARDRLIETNAFPNELLSDEEKSNLARNQWRQVGPRGLHNRDYTMLVLYEAVRGQLDAQRGDR